MFVRPDSELKHALIWALLCSGPWWDNTFFSNIQISSLKGEVWKPGTVTLGPCCYQWLPHKLIHLSEVDQRATLDKINELIHLKHSWTACTSSVLAQNPNQIKGSLADHKCKMEAVATPPNISFEFSILKPRSSQPDVTVFGWEGGVIRYRLELNCSGVMKNNACLLISAK